VVFGILAYVGFSVAKQVKEDVQGRPFWKKVEEFFITDTEGTQKSVESTALNSEECGR
jgi:hypothetical protein